MIELFKLLKNEYPIIFKEIKELLGVQYKVFTKEEVNIEDNLLETCQEYQDMFEEYEDISIIYPVLKEDLKIYNNKLNQILSL